MSAVYDPDHITYFAETDFRNQKTRFGIKSHDRTRHMYVIGKSGVGKSTLLENMAIQDIQNGQGVAVLDPHGSFAEKMLDYVPAERIKDVIYFAPFDTDNPISFNVLEDVGADKRHLVVSGLMSTFKKIWVDAWSARMEYILSNTLLALLEYPDATLLGVNRMLSDKEFRKKVVDNITDTSVKAFWVEEFAKYTERMAAEAVPAIQNKIGQLTANPLIRNIIGQPKSSFNIRTAMDEQKILIINLSKGRIGDTNTSLLGSMIITKIYLAAMSRAETRPEEMAKLPNFYFYVDEFQSFANETFADILAEARKYKLALIIAHQYVAQMEEKVRDAVFGNVGTTVSFRVGPLDAELLEKVFAPQFTANDLINLGMAQIYLSLMINDIGSQPFSARTLPPVPRQAITYRNDCIEWSREHYAVGRGLVEEAIGNFYAAKNTSDEGISPTKKPILYPQKISPVATVQKPFQKAFAVAEHVDTLPKQDTSHEPKVHAKPLKPLNEGVSGKTLFTRVREQAKTEIKESESINDPSLHTLLSTLDFSVKPVSKPVEKKEIPIDSPSSKEQSTITDDAPFANMSRPLVKGEERAAKESSKALLRDALSKIALSATSKQSVSDEVILPPSETPSFNDQYTVPLSTPAHTVMPLTKKEISHEEIRKILE